MMSPMDKFTSPKDMLRNKHVFSRERVVEMERPVRCIIHPRVSLGQRWHVIRQKIKKKFPKGFPGLKSGGCRGKEQLKKGSSLFYLIKHSWRRPKN